MLLLQSVILNLLKNIGSFFKARDFQNRPVAFFCLLPFILYLLVVIVPAASAKTAILGWDPNSEPDLEGYVVYRNNGSPGPPYKYSDDVPEDDLVDPLHPRATLTGLQEGKEYYVALTAYNTSGVESAYSNDVCIEVVDGNIEQCSSSSGPSAPASSSSGGSGGSGGGGGGGAGCFISGLSDKPPELTQFFAIPVAGMLVLLLLILKAAVRPAAGKTHQTG